MTHHWFSRGIDNPVKRFTLSNLLNSFLLLHITRPKLPIIQGLGQCWFIGITSCPGQPGSHPESRHI